MAVAGLQSGLTTHWLEYNVLNWDYPEIAEFRKMVMIGLLEFKLVGGDPDHSDYQISGISCWANVLRYGEYLEVHHHDPSFVSAHYQVRAVLPKMMNRMNRKWATPGTRFTFVQASSIGRHGGKQAGTTSPLGRRLAHQRPA